MVNNLNSDGTGSLQDVVSNAIDGSTITFRPGLKGTITLSHNLILDKHLILHGPGAGDIVISSGKNNQNYQISVSGQSVLIDGLGFENSVLGTNVIHNTGDLTLAHSIISGNNVSDNLINNENGTLSITNSTISGNTADASGGGIANLSSKTLLSFCTIYGNRAKAGGGIVVLAGTDTLSKNIVAGNTLFAGKQPFHPHIMGTLLSQGYNLIQNMTNVVPKRASTPDTSNIAFSHFTPAHDRTVSTVVDLTKILFDPQGLQNNGGPTKTYKLLSGQSNPAVDAIPLASCLVMVKDATGQNMIITTDQRGMPRPDDKEPFCDVGAYESSG